MKKKILAISAVLCVATVLSLLMTSCNGEYTRDKGQEWKTKFDVTLPNVSEAGTDQLTANADGWYQTLNEGFDTDTLSQLFTPSPHGLRRGEYWCDQMVSLRDGNAVIAAQHDENHSCDVCGVKSGDFTSGIETRKTVDTESVPLFEQAFGYFEARVKFPTSGGMWSAFWLQSNSVSNVGFDGEDGTEIDIYESSFYNTNRQKMGHALHYDGYASKQHKCQDSIQDSQIDLYDGFHTFALKWTPNEYVFYIDGKVSWASDFGGVSKVPAFLRFTNEVRPGKVGPYGQRLGQFDGGEFLIDYVKVYQNNDYLSAIKSPADFVSKAK